MKKFFALVVSLILILSLTACGGSDSSTDSAPASGASSADPAAKTEIVYGKSQGPYTELFEAAIVPILEEQGYRSGTPALALAVSIEKALQLTLTQQEERIRCVRQLNEYLKTALLHYPSVRINSPEGAVPHILNLSVQGLKGTVFQRVLSERGVCVSVKSACSAEGTPSKAVFAVSGDRKNALSSWRVSLSHLTTREELDEFLQVFDQCYKELVP